MAERLVESGWRRDDSVILAAAGTSDARRRARPARDGGTGCRPPPARVELAYAATGTPRVPTRWPRLRRRGARRVVVASYLLAEGLFQDRLRASGADLVAEPLGSASGDGAADRQPVQARPGTGRRERPPDLRERCSIGDVCAGYPKALPANSHCVKRG